MNQFVFAAEVETNWNWLTLSMKIAKTNFCIGEKIAVSVTVSNIGSEQHFIPWYAGDPCDYGMGHFEITSGNSSIPCRLTPALRAQLIHYYLTSLNGHGFKTFEADLTSGYDMTNAGPYNICAVDSFAQQGTNQQFNTVTTPPIIISMAPKFETNMPSK